MTVLKQIGIVLGGLLMAAIMIGLGIWQLNVYESQGRDAAVARAEAPPLEVTSVARPGQEVGDVYGRRVRFTGKYDATLQSYIADPDHPGRYRVLTALRLDSGGILPVVRGVVDGKNAPTPPADTVTETGILLPSEGADAQAAPSGQPTSVVLAALAQQWPGDLVNGYATLSADEARAQSLEPATIQLPSSHGRLRNGFYALQWWVFAGFAVVMAIRIARDLGRESEPTPDETGSGSDEPSDPEEPGPGGTDEITDRAGADGIHAERG